MTDTYQPMTELDSLRETNPLTDLDTVLWTELESEGGYTTIDLTDRLRMIVLDLPVVDEFIMPDLHHIYEHLETHITGENSENRPLEFVPYLLELIPYGVPAAGLYKMVDAVTHPEMETHTAIVAVMQAYVCCMTGWLSEDQRYERLQPQPLATRELPSIDHQIVVQRLAETVPDIDPEEVKPNVKTP